MKIFYHYESVGNIEVSIEWTHIPVEIDQFNSEYQQNDSLTFSNQNVIEIFISFQISNQ